MNSLPQNPEILDSHLSALDYHAYARFHAMITDEDFKNFQKIIKEGGSKY